MFFTRKADWRVRSAHVRTSHVRRSLHSARFRSNLAELADNDEDDNDDEADIDQRVLVCASRLRQYYDAGPLGIVENGIRYIHRKHYYQLLPDALEVE